MRLQFLRDYASISIFSPIELPDFTVLTGVNGAGKSQLFKAIEIKHVSVSGINGTNIVIFNHDTFQLENAEEVNAHKLWSEQHAAWGFFTSSLRGTIQKYKSSYSDAYEVLKHRCIDTNTCFLDVATADNGMGDYKNQISNLFIERHDGTDRERREQTNLFKRGINSITKTLPYSIDEIEREEFGMLYKSHRLKGGFLPDQLGLVFWDYYVKYKRNQFCAYENEKYEKNNYVLSEEEFIEAHGEKPWGLANRILRSFGSIDLEFNSPEGSDHFGNFHLYLKNTKNGAPIAFQGLSSGEKTLLALVASVYRAHTADSFPDLLLLDEIDTSLHPSMIKTMLEVIKDVFLKRNIKVILITHAPTTIALAPEDSIYVMNKSGKDRINKTSKEEALKILTEGYATLEEGIKFFDYVATKKVAIVTEGNNTKLIQKACELFKRQDIQVITGVEAVSGKNQLKTLFEFFSRVDHENKVIFVLDCDVSYTLKECNNTFPYILKKNDENAIATKGIENMFPAMLFDSYKKTMTRSLGEIIEEFDENRKRDFEEYVIGRNKIEDFQNFKQLFDYIDSVISP